MILLIHGAWHGAWVWQRLDLRHAWAPELDGSPGATLSSHVADVVALIAAAPDPVALVGHSYGAAVAAIAAARMPDRVASLIAVDGLLLRPGQAIIDLMPPTVAADWRRQGGMVRPLPVEIMAVGNRDRAMVAARLRPQPLGCFTEAAPDIAAYAGPRRFIRAIKFAFPPLDRIAARAAREGWRRETIETGHDAMLAAPDQLRSLFFL